MQESTQLNKLICISKKGIMNIVKRGINCIYIHSTNWTKDTTYQGFSLDFTMITAKLGLFSKMPIIANYSQK